MKNEISRVALLLMNHCLIVSDTFRLLFYVRISAENKSKSTLFRCINDSLSLIFGDNNVYRCRDSDNETYIVTLENVLTQLSL